MRRRAILQGLLIFFPVMIFSQTALSPRTPPKFRVIVCAGDSLMRPVPGHLRELRRTDSFKFVLMEWAQGGLNSETYRKYFLKRCEIWKSVRPDMILLQLGTNDARPILRKERTAADFERGMREIFSEFGKFRSESGAAPRLLVATVPPFMFFPEAGELNAVVDKIINPILKKAAAEVGADIVDQHSVLKAKPDLYEADGIHPNPSGEMALAGNWFRAMKKAASEPATPVRLDRAKAAGFCERGVGNTI